MPPRPRNQCCWPDHAGIRTEMAVFFEGCARQSYATTLNQGDGGLERFFGVMVAAWLFFLKNPDYVRGRFLDLWMCTHMLEQIISAFKSPVRTLFYPCSCCPGPKKPQCRTADFARSRNASTYMSLHMNWQAAKGFNGYAMQHQNDSKYMYVLTHVWLGKLCSPRLNMVIWPMLFSKVLVRIHETFF